MKKATITAVTPAGPDHNVLTLHGGGARACTSPCAECPWRKDSPPGAFPADAYRASAITAYDASESMFSCHVAGHETPALCAGFLLQNAVHNLGVRLLIATHQLDPRKIFSGGLPLYSTYREMAIANGVPPDDPALVPCRDNGEEWQPNHATRFLYLTKRNE